MPSTVIAVPAQRRRRSSASSRRRWWNTVFKAMRFQRVAAGDGKLAHFLRVSSCQIEERGGFDQRRLAGDGHRLCRRATSSVKQSRTVADQRGLVPWLSSALMSSRSILPYALPATRRRQDSHYHRSRLHMTRQCLRRCNNSRTRITAFCAWRQVQRASRWIDLSMYSNSNTQEVHRTARHVNLDTCPPR